eukprot:Sspe_Gene.77518::Locus_48449_Transcript_1_1_Confidence_1.000_Length_1352::g.77518::m.77518/K03924/moxR; MoxR-like ATPase
MLSHPSPTVYDLVASALLLRPPATQCGHVLLLLHADPDMGTDVLGGEKKPDRSGMTDTALVRQCLGKGLCLPNLPPTFTVTDNTKVKDLASWLYNADLGDSQQWKVCDQSEADMSPSSQELERKGMLSDFSSDDGDGSVWGQGPHRRRLLVMVHDVHHAKPEVQQCLLEAMQHQTLYGSGESTLRNITVVATCPESKLLCLSHALRERFTLSARIPRLHPHHTVSLPQYSVLPHSLRERLAEDPTTVGVRVFGCLAKGSVHPPRGQYLSSSLQRYLHSAIIACRQHPAVGSVIPSHKLFTHCTDAVKAYSLSGGRGFVSPEDIRALLPHLLAHRLHLAPSIEDNSLVYPAPPHRDDFWGCRGNEDIVLATSLVLANDSSGGPLPVDSDEGVRTATCTASAAKHAFEFVAGIAASISVPL